MDQYETQLELGDPRRDPDLADHVDTYQHFSRGALYAACAAPFFFAFVLYWTQ